MKNFNQLVYETVRQTPKGSVATYGQIAALVGNPRAARAVGWAMHQMDNLPVSPNRDEPQEEFKKYPWWRVVNAQGFISTTCREHTFEIQKQLLENDGIEVVWDDKMQMYNVDLKKYLWQS